MTCPTCNQPTENGTCPACGEDPVRHPLADGAPLAPGYVVRELVAQDSSSFRYLVESEDGTRYVARVFTARWCERAEVRSTIRSSALAQSRVAHPNVVGVRDMLKTDQGELTLVADYADAPTAEAYLASGGPLHEEDAAHIVQQVLQALSACHRRGLHHLGLRPACVTVREEEAARLTVRVDGFGLGRVLPEDETHWAPEQHEGSATDERTDVHAAGLLLYELLTGELPPEGELDLRGTLPTLNIRLERAIRRALAKDPDERFSSAEEMAVGLASNSLIRSAVPSAPQTVERDSTSNLNRAVFGAAAFALLLLALVMVWQLSRQGGEPEAADHNLSVEAEAERTMATARSSASGHLTIPAMAADAPVPISALPGANARSALVDVVLTTDLRSPFSSPAGLSFVDDVRTRYGDNVRIATLVVVGGDLSEEERAATRERHRAALAAQLQGRFSAYANRLVRTPALSDADGLVALAKSLGLDGQQFALDMVGEHITELELYHQQLAFALDTDAPGQAYVNGRRLEAAPGTPHVLSGKLVTAAIDAELDSVQSLLVAGESADAVAQHRTAAALAEPARHDVEGRTDAYNAARTRTDLEGVPGLGPADAPLSVVLFVDPSTDEGRSMLSQVLGFYEENPESVRVRVKLAPALTRQAGFDAALALLEAHASGDFWRLVEELRAGNPLPVPRRGAATELFRSRIVAHSREVALLGEGTEGVVLANGRRLDAHPVALDLGLHEELSLVKALVAGGVSARDVRPLVEATFGEPTSEPSQAEARFVLVNWQALPRLGPVDAPVQVFWQFSLESPEWPQTLEALLRLHDEMKDAVAICLVPPPGEGADAVSLRLLERWWGREDKRAHDELHALALVAAGAPDETGALTPAEVEERFEALVSEPSVTTSEGPLHVRPRAVLWSPEQTPVGGVVVAWERDMHFVGYRAPGGWAYDPYWELVRLASRAPR